LAQEGLSVLIIEAKATIGGGARTQELTLPGYHHDVCAAVHPLALASPFFRSLNLEVHGLEWIFPPIPLAHPLDDAPAVLLDPSIEVTANGLGEDADSYQSLIRPLVENWEKLVYELLKPLGRPKHPLLLLRFTRHAMKSTTSLVNAWFRGKRTQALFAGNSAHSILPLERASSAAFGMMLSVLGHAVGWPIAKGGSQKISDTLASCFRSLGGEIQIGAPVSSIHDIPKARAILFDITPRQLARIAGSRLPSKYCMRLERHCHGPGVFKVDWALSHPIPWKDPNCARAGTLHLGGTLNEIAQSERQVWMDTPSEKPFVLLSQPSLFDSSRAPSLQHTAWAYCHVPNGCTMDMTDRIEAQVERFAPGFREYIITRNSMFPADLEKHNPNCIGGDIVGGVQSFRSLFVRPLGRWQAYATPVKGLYICSSSMPPGGGVHGMCGFLAAHSALRQVFGHGKNCRSE
jgi:phytoene dehydrogenase-like protein